MRKLRCALLVALAWFCTAGPALAQQSAFDPKPWLADIEQIRVALKTRYANREWLEQGRGVSIDALMDRVAARARTVDSEAEMRALLDQLVRRIGDGHVELHWPHKTAPVAAPAPVPASDPASVPRAEKFCARLGYDKRRASPGIAAASPGYRALDGDNVVPAGWLDVAGARLGIVRIAEFAPQAFPALCIAAVTRLKLPLDRDCEDGCQDAVLTDAYAHLTLDYEARLRQLREVGATAVMVDLTGNGGGSEWAEAAARSLSARPLTSERMGFVRGEHWAKQWRTLASQLRDWAKQAKPAERAQLLAWAAESEAARIQAETPCDPATGCAWLGRAGYSTGLVGSAGDGAFRDKPWGPYVFSAGQHTYHGGAWSGPVIVLTDQETWSAAEEFAAVLQDNRTAIVLGARTGGAGCGHTMGGTPETLTNSGAVLELPDCVRFRAEGSNEVDGVIPDVLIGWRANDGTALRVRLLAAALPEAMRRASELRQPPR